MKPTKKSYAKLKKVVDSMEGYKYLKDGKANFYALDFIFIVDLTATNPEKKDIAYVTVTQLHNYLIK